LLNKISTVSSVHAEWLLTVTATATLITLSVLLCMMNC